MSVYNDICPELTTIVRKTVIFKYNAAARDNCLKVRVSNVGQAQHGFGVVVPKKSEADLSIMTKPKTSTGEHG